VLVNRLARKTKNRADFMKKSEKLVGEQFGFLSYVRTCSKEQTVSFAHRIFQTY